LVFFFALASRTVVAGCFFVYAKETNLPVRAAPRYGPDHFELMKSECVIVDEVVGMSTEDIGHLEGRPAHSVFLGRRLGLSPNSEIGSASIGLCTACK
jgi:hypothetical protein